MLDEDAISRIRGFCNCNVGKLDDENRGQKNRKCWFDFFQSQFSSPNHTHITPHPIAIIAGPSMGNENRPKKSTDVLDFLVSFSSPHHPHTTTPHPIAIIAEDSMVVENCAKKIENVGLTFSTVIFASPPS